jgi:hypothetical protein
MLASFIHYEAVWGKQDMDVEHWERSEELMEHRLCGYPKMERLRMVPFRFLGTPLGKTCSRRIILMALRVIMRTTRGETIH